MDGTLYYNVKDWLRSIRPTSIGRVFRPFLLGGGLGSTQKQRRLWSERAAQVEDKNARLESLEPPLYGHRLAIFAAEEISRVAQGKAGTGKTGRPRKPFTEDQWQAIRDRWPRRHGVKVHEAVADINKAIAPRKVTAGWLYANVK